MNRIEVVIAGVLAALVGLAVGLFFDWLEIGLAAGVACWAWFLSCMKEESIGLKEWKALLVWVLTWVFDGVLGGVVVVAVLMCFFGFGFYMGGT